MARAQTMDSKVLVSSWQICTHSFLYDIMVEHAITHWWRYNRYPFQILQTMHFQRLAIFLYQLVLGAALRLGDATLA